MLLGFSNFKHKGLRFDHISQKSLSSYTYEMPAHLCRPCSVMHVEEH
ncbi:unnamed protein product [Musa acuminata subsp. malaccensis]|uniref:(wild Malaysian banana) hypothetical protein n=1 Tax=Musa acuminata subsp. malaccensis TaxID=214687 RepID=A0A804L4K0_MUSAM|nr:unnamed protein product [Musa acuminata subsp. malaccensis]